MSDESFVALVPVKPPSVGKSRLQGLSDDLRRNLAEAFARDTIAAVLSCELVAEVLVVTDDFALAGQLREDGCSVMPDGVTGDLNASLRLASAEAHRRWSAHMPVAICADLPALRGDDLTRVLAAVRERVPGGAAFVPDAAGTGTTLYTAVRSPFVPQFGPGSAAAHAAMGAVCLDEAPVSIRTDIDDRADLARAVEFGVGAHTALLTTRR